VLMNDIPMIIVFESLCTETGIGGSSMLCGISRCHGYSVERGTVPMANDCEMGRTSLLRTGRGDYLPEKPSKERRILFLLTFEVIV
jgi:hypothetical protein